MLSSVMGVVGGGFGYVLQIMFVASSDRGQVAKDHILKLCQYTLAIFASLYTISMILFRQKPPTPPTYTTRVIKLKIGSLR